MFSYVMLGTNNLKRAIAFYDPLMLILGHPRAGSNEEGVSWGTFNDNETCGLCIGRPFDCQAATVGNGVMIALKAHDATTIQKLHAVAMASGGTDEGSPGFRPQYGPNFYSAYVRDPDGNKIAFVCYASSHVVSQK